MEKLLLKISVSILAMTFVIANPVFAEAPVFDADTQQQQLGNDSDQGQELPPPPPPEQSMSNDSASDDQENADDNLPAIPNPGAKQRIVPSREAEAKPADPRQIGPAIETDNSINVPPPPPAPIRPMTPDERLRKVEQQINNMQASDPVAHIEALQQQVQTLRGQVEQLTHQLELMQNQQKATYADLDKRVSQQGNIIKQMTNQDVTATTLNGSASDADDDASKMTRKEKQLAKKEGKLGSNEFKAVARGEQPNVAEEQQIYQTAYNFIKAKKYNEAVNALQGMLQKYPTGQFAANAHYWLGELYGLMGKNDRSLTEFTIVVQNHPGSPRVSDAQYKVGVIYASQSKWADAKTAFRKVISRYPGSTSARLASDQLKQIESAGN